MPPKPWEKNRISQPVQNDALSKQIEQNNIETTKMSEDIIQSSPIPEATEGTTTNSTNNTTGSLNNTSSYNRYGGGMGGMYGGGMGGMYGGMGGMYGGGMYGGGYGMGGMYGGNMGMMGMDPNNPGFLQNSMQYLHSLGYVMMSLSEISRNLEMNAEGLGRFWGSLYNLVLRMKGWGVQFFKTIIGWIGQTINWVKSKINQKLNILTGKEQNHLHYQTKVLSVSIKILTALIMISMLPLLAGFWSSENDELFEESLKA